MIQSRWFEKTRRRLLHNLSVVRQISVAFRSAKERSFAERKATIKDRTMLSEARAVT